ncbi:MAG: heparinase II/III family protein [Pseudomonadota bacterium]|nr:heparinase II/III family protein [Pseudomonadota bacterium]
MFRQFDAFIRRVRGKSFREIFVLVVGAFQRRAQRLRSRLCDQFLPSFGCEKTLPSGKWKWRFREEWVLPLCKEDRFFDDLCCQAVRHEFDLLGTGLVSFNRREVCTEQSKIKIDRDGQWLAHFVTSPNLKKSKKIWSLIFQGKWAHDKYEPINWHLDVKSGAVWDSKTWYFDVTIVKALGADIKVPWELARLQHLPQLAVQVKRKREQKSSDLNQIVQEIRAQVLDFIACNPPRYGMHWRNPMEMSIRGANILLCLDILNSAGIVLDDEEMSVIHSFLDSQSRHILSNLEWSECERGNHYFANILGILFSASYLPSTIERSTWMAFAVDQLIIEIERQFLADGGNFEGSAGYHRLTLEMALYGIAIIDGLNADELSELSEYDSRLLSVRPSFSNKTLQFYKATNGKSLIPQNVKNKVFAGIGLLADLTRPDNRFTQIGDIDSARFFKLKPVMRGAREDTINGEAVIDAGKGLFSAVEKNSMHLDAQVIRQLSRGGGVSGTINFKKRLYLGNYSDAFEQFSKKFFALPENFRRKVCIFGSVPINALVFSSYPDFGAFFLKGPGFHLVFRCFDPRCGGAWGHAHDDNLSIELVLEGKPRITDPGSFVYTSNPELRSLYRGPHSHFAPRVVGRAAAHFQNGLFGIEHSAYADCMYAGREGFIGQLVGADWQVYRMINLRQERVEIWDYSVGAELAPLYVKDAKHMISDGYGRETQNSICAL